MNAIITWALARAEEKSTWIGAIGLIGTMVLHKTLPPGVVDDAAQMIVGMISAGMVAASTKKVTPVVVAVAADVPTVTKDWIAAQTAAAAQAGANAATKQG